MTGIPRDPVMLLSYINTQLRDFYPSLEELCSALSLDRETLDETLSSIDYFYDRDRTSICKARLSAYPAAFSATLFLWKTE